MRPLKTAHVLTLTCATRLGWQTSAMRSGLIFLSLLQLGVVAAGCTRERAVVAAKSCSQDRTLSCRCEGGALGRQRCDARGSAVGSCECGATAAGAERQTTGQAGGAAGTAAQGGSAAPSNAASNAGTAGASAGGAGGGKAGSVGAAGSAGSALAAAGGRPAPSAEITAEPQDEASFLFDASQVHTYNILIAAADLASIDRMPAAEVLVPASLELDGTRYGPYKVRYKGSAGAFVYPCTMGAPDAPKNGKCSLKLDFNDTDPNARFYGLKKLNLHAMNADVSMLRDRLGYRMFREMGVPAPRAAHARVLINGQLEGLFIAVEQIDGRFTRGRFGEGGEGNIYKEIWPMHDDAAAYTKALESNTKQPNVQRMLDFQSAVASSPSAAEAFLDRGYMLRVLAVDRLIMNDDGFLHFWCNDNSTQGNNPGMFGNHNYYWYEESQHARFWLVPWDLDNSFDNSETVRIEPAWNQQVPAAQCSCTQHPVSGPQRPAACDPLVGLLLSWNADYERAVDAFLAGPYSKANIDGLLDQWTMQIRPIVAEAAGLKLAPTEEQWAQALETLRSKIEGARAAAH